MTCKGTGGKRSKYMYYFCDNCNLYYNEDEIEDCLIVYILDLVEYDFNVKNTSILYLLKRKTMKVKKLRKKLRN